MTAPVSAGIASSGFAITPSAKPQDTGGCLTPGDSDTHFASKGSQQISLSESLTTFEVTSKSSDFEPDWCPLLKQSMWLGRQLQTSNSPVGASQVSQMHPATQLPRMVQVSTTSMFSSAVKSATTPRAKSSTSSTSEDHGQASHVAWPGKYLPN